LLRVFKHSSQPRALGVTFLMVPRCEQLLLMIITRPHCRNILNSPHGRLFVAELLFPPHESRHQFGDLVCARVEREMTCLQEVYLGRRYVASIGFWLGDIK